MKFSKMSPEEAERLARRDRNRLIAMSVLAVLLGAAYLFTRMQSASTERAQDDELAGEIAPVRPTDVTTDDDILVPRFESPELLDRIADDTDAGRETLDPDVFEPIFEYARLVSQEQLLRAMGREELKADLQTKLSDDPNAGRLTPLRVRGRVVTARKRAGDQDESWRGTLETLDGRHVHFVAARAPLRANGLRAIADGDFLRMDGLFYGLFSAPLEIGGAFENVTAPLVLGRELVAAPAPVTEDIAARTPALASVVDDSIDDVSPASDFDEARWQLMGKALMLDAEVDWDNAPELDSAFLEQLYRNGDELRGMAFRIPVSVNLDTFSKRIGDNPLGLERITEGWIGNMTWKGPAKAIRWYGPFERRDMVREELDDQHRYVTGRGFFFRNHVYDNAKGQPARAPIFVMSDVSVYEIPPDLSARMFVWIVLGGTIVVTGLMFLLLMADRKKSKALYEDMIRRRRARRGKEEAQAPA